MPFEPSPHREEIIEALKAGEPPDEVAKRFPVSRKTVERQGGYSVKLEGQTVNRVNRG